MAWAKILMRAFFNTQWFLYGKDWLAMSQWYNESF